MALKYGSKPSGFGLRSGNKKGMPFKQMGASTPAKGMFDFLKGKTDEEKNIEKFKEETVIVDGKTYKKGEEPQPKSKTGSAAIEEVTKEATEKHGKLSWEEGHTEENDAHREKGNVPDNVETKDGGKEKKGKWWKSNAFKEGMYNLAAITATDPSKRQMYLQKSQEYKKPAELTEGEKEDLAYKDNRRKIQELTIKQKQQELGETTKPNAKENDPTSEQVNIATRDNTKGLSQEEIDLVVGERQAGREKEMDTKYGYLDTETGEWVPGTFMDEQKTTT